jgi:hypothetical protein
MQCAGAEPRQERWREQCRVSVGTAVNLRQTARPEILDAGSTERNHLPTLASRQCGSRRSVVNCSSITMWHHIVMPDDLHLPVPRRQPEDINFGVIKTDLEFIMERLSKLSTRERSR